MLKFDKKYTYTEDFRPIAQVNKVKDGKDSKYGYIFFENVTDEEEKNNSSDEESSDEEILDCQCPYCRKIFSCKKAKDTHLIRGSCKTKVINDYIKYAYKGKKVDANLLISQNSVKLTGNYKFSPLADPKNRENVLIIGPQNSGKSYYTSMYAKSYKKMFPDNDIILGSRIEDDKSFRDLKDIVRLDLTEDLVDDPIDIKEELSPSLTIFDDIDNSQYSKALSKYVWDLNSEILTNGRDQSGEGNHIYSVTTMHITEGPKTRKILNEATSIVLFLPLGYQEKRILKLYAGLSPQQITKVSKLKSRWVAVYTKYRPQFIMSEKELFLLSDF